MAYAVLTAFLEPLAQEATVPASSKTPAYWARTLGREWSLLGAAELEGKLLPFFEEFNRMCEAEKATKA